MTFCNIYYNAFVVWNMLGEEFDWLIYYICWGYCKLVEELSCAMREVGGWVGEGQRKLEKVAWKGILTKLEEKEQWNLLGLTCL